MNVLSIQSQVVYGHVGNSAAAFVLQRQGHAVWQVPTVLFSNHLGKPTFRGRDVPAEQARDLVEGLKELGYLDDVDMLLTGYLGTPDTARMAAELAGLIRAQNPRAIFACDPVMGDDDELYVKPDLAEAIASELIQAADVLLPNIFELGRLTGRVVKDEAAALDAARALQEQTGVKLVIATGVPTASPDRIAALALSGKAVHRAEAPRRKLRVSGTGDTFSALFNGHYVTSRDAAKSLDFAMRAMDVICTATSDADADELLIVQTQEQWAKLSQQSRSGGSRA
jgi:pyridoxine kinase